MEEQIKVSDFMSDAMKDDIFNIAYNDNCKLDNSQYSADLRTILEFFSWGTYTMSDSFPYQFESMSCTGYIDLMPIISYVFKRKSDGKCFILHTHKFNIQFDHLCQK